MITIGPKFDRNTDYPAESIWSETEYTRWGGRGWLPRVRFTGGILTHVTDLTRYSPALIDKLTSETGWVAKTTPAPLTEDQRVGIGKGEIPCPRHAEGTTYIPIIYTGTDTGISVYSLNRCLCHFLQNFFRKWEKVPELYRDVSYDKLAPMDSDDVLLSLERQKEIIDTVKSAPGDNYLFYGDSRTGKTHISYALHRLALVNWAKDSMTRDVLYAPVLRSQVTTLLDQHTAATNYDRKNEDDPKPKVSIDVPKIQRIVDDKSRPVVILDELDKLGNPTEFRIRTIHAILDAAIEAKGQIIATANRSPSWMINAWGKEVAEPIIYRCGGGTKGHTIRFAEK